MKKQKSRRSIAIIIVVVALTLFAVAVTAAGAFALRYVNRGLDSLSTQLSAPVLEEALQFTQPDTPNAPTSIYDAGVLIKGVDPAGPAAQAGIRRGTIILNINDTAVDTPEDLSLALTDIGAGQTVTLTILNGPFPEDVVVTLADVPPLLGVQMVGDSPAGSFGFNRGQFAVPDSFEDLPLNPEDFNFDMEAFAEGVIIAEVIADSGAEAAGLRAGDVIKNVDDTAVTTVDELVALLADKTPGDTVALSILRAGDALEISVTLGANPDDDSRAFLGISPGPAFGRFEGGRSGPGDFNPRDFNPDDFNPGDFNFGDLTQSGAVVVEVVVDTPAAVAGLESGDVIKTVDGVDVETVDSLVEMLGAKSPGDSVTLSVLRDDETIELEATLAANPDDPQRAFLGVQLGAFFNIDAGQFGEGERFAPGEFFFHTQPGDGNGRFFGLPDDFQLPEGFEMPEGFEEFMPHFEDKLQSEDADMNA